LVASLILLALMAGAVGVQGGTGVVMSSCPLQRFFLRAHPHQQSLFAAVDRAAVNRVALTCALESGGVGDGRSRCRIDK